MRNLNLKTLLSLVLFSGIASTSAWAERILISDVDQTVTLEEPFDCYSSAQITIDTAQPEIYEQAYNRLQSVTDAARAILRYECPNLAEINVKGKIRGLHEFVYEGVSRSSNQWLISARDEAALNHSSVDTWSNKSDSEHWQRIPGEHVLSDKSLTLTGIQLGMTVSEVTDIISKTFDITPEYDAQTGLLVMHKGGCPQEVNQDSDYQAAQASWKCLSAQFTDQRQARLEHLELVQVAKSNAYHVQRALIDKYGAPIEQRLARFDQTSELVWRALDDDSPHDNQTQELNAILSEIGSDRVVTRLSLSRTPSNTQESVNYADLGLSL